MNKPVLILSIRNGRGDAIAEIALEAQAPANHNNERPAHEVGVTDAQRRMLFRLAARLGFEGEAARQYVDRRLGPDADRRAASRLIDDLQDEIKRTHGGGRDDRAS